MAGSIIIKYSTQCIPKNVKHQIEPYILILGGVKKSRAHYGKMVLQSNLRGKMRFFFLPRIPRFPESKT